MHTCTYYAVDFVHVLNIRKVLVLYALCMNMALITPTVLMHSLCSCIIMLVFFL